MVYSWVLYSTRVTITIQENSRQYGTLMAYHETMNDG